MLDKEFKKLLKKYTPSEKGIELYCKLLLKSYNTKVAKFQKIKNAANEEIQKLHALRQAIIEKNLNGVFSDEIFKEQNAVIEEKLIAAQSAKNDALLDNYNIQSIIEFIKKKISNLEETYSTSNLSQIRCFLRSIFLSGFAWTYPGCSNDKISPLYQPILEVREGTVALGDPTGSRIPVFRMRT